MGRKKVSSTKKKKGSLSQNTDILGAVYIVISLILIVFLSFSNIGDIPDFINELLKGLFGYMAYLIPVVLGFVGIYSIVSNKKIVLTHELGKGFAIMMCVVITISSFAITDFSMFDNILKYISNTYNAALNGTNFVGLIGSMITCLGVKVVGIMATRLIFITATLITILCAFNISLRQLFYAIYNIFAYIFNCIYSICAILFRKDETINEQLEFEKEQKVSRRERLANEKELKHKIELEKKLFESGSSEVEKNLKSDNCDQIEFDFNKLGGRVCDNEIQAKQQRDEFFKKQKEQKVDKDVKEVLTLDHVNHVEVDNYVFPPIDLLKVSKMGETFDKKAIHATAVKLQKTLASFGVEAKVTNITHGPTVTRYELTPNTGVKVSKIVNLCDDIALNLAAKSIRIEAPIPGRAAVGIEVPNISPDSVSLREVIESQSFIQHKSSLAFALGKDAAGELVTGDISKMPHTLIAGATGSGKSVCINSIIVSILYKAKPSEVKMILVDPKMVELSGYNGIPHLLIPVVTDPKKAAGALNWAVQEMVNRYNLFASKGVKDIKGYNAIMEKDDEAKLPQMVIIIDELADLMMVAPNDVEEAICRLAQMARAARYAFDNCYSTSIC